MYCVPHQQHISKSSRTWHNHMDHSLSNQTMVWQRYCTWPNRRNVLLWSSRTVWSLHCTKLLSNYLCHIPVAYMSKLLVYVCCDNQGVITQINNHEMQPVNPNHMIFDEYRVYNEIQKILQTLSLLIIQFIHILGHQDTCIHQKLHLKPN